MYVCMYRYVCLYVCICIYVHVYVYVYMYICIYVYYIHTQFTRFTGTKVALLVQKYKYWRSRLSGRAEKDKLEIEVEIVVEARRRGIDQPVRKVPIL